MTASRIERRRVDMPGFCNRNTDEARTGTPGVDNLNIYRPRIDTPRADTQWARRARPLLGTLVEIGVPAGAAASALCDGAFTAIAEIQAGLSRFDAESDVARFAALCAGKTLQVRAPTVTVLNAARELQRASGGVFDVTLGSGPDGWRLRGCELRKLDDGVQFDLGGIAKGHAVDCAVQALIARDCVAGWVNAGGDLRAFGAIAVPVLLRDEDRGGVWPFAQLSDGAFATSHFDRGTRSHAVDARSKTARRGHASVAAPLCLWADALTKLVAVSGDAAHPLLARYGACAWLHPAR